MINKHSFFEQEKNNPSNSLTLENARLGVLGGSGIYSIDCIKDIKEVEIETPFGKPSDKLRVGLLGGMEVVSL